MRRILFLILILWVSTSGFPENPVVNGFVQGWFSYGQQNTDDPPAVGFTFRRIKLSLSGKIEKSIDWRIKFGWDRENPDLTEAYVTFRFSPEIRLRAGKFPVPGSPSGTLTRSDKIDFIERATVVQKWGEHSRLHGYRSTGLQVDGRFLEGRLYTALMIFNADAGTLFNPGIGDYTYRGSTSVQYSGRIEFFPLEGVRIGGFFLQGKDSVGGITNQSFGGHLFYVRGGINAKVEYLLGQNEYETAGAPLKYNGYQLKFGYRMPPIEPILRFDEYRERGAWGLIMVKRSTNITLGINTWYGDHLKLQANYVVRDESMTGGLQALRNNLFYINLQYTF